MTMDATNPTRFPAGRRRAMMAAAALFAAQLGVIGAVFKHAINFTCIENWPLWACAGASGTLIAVYCVLGALTLLVMLKPAPFLHLCEQAGERLWPLALNAAGLLLSLAPVLMLAGSTGADAMWPAFLCWVPGFALLLAGLLMFIAPLARWRAFVANTWTLLLPVLLGGMAAPYLATLIRPLWRLDTIADLTFTAVAKVIDLLGYTVTSDPADKVIGAGDFFISVAPVCSGIEGIALVTVFVSLYLWLFRADLRFPLAFILYPLGILASALFNIVRISALLVIGLEGNPELAVGGFHSHAGWLLFTAIALGIIALAQTVPALQRKQPDSGPQPRVAALPFRQDPVSACILPFAVFMLSALPASALVSTPGVVYPLRVLLMMGVLALFLPLYRRLPWRLDPVAVGAGLAIGLMWVLIPVEPSDVAPYGGLTGALLVGWFLLRGLGTMLFVPIIEELFFRDYLESRLRLGTGTLWTILAAIVTAGLFAALHDRWAEAFAAGLVFSWVMRRHGRVTDAITAHAVANALVFGVAVATGNLAII